MRASREHGFDVISYVYMPDHHHSLVEGTRDDSDFIKWLNLFRQLSGFAEKRRSNQTLWQEGYWDYTLRGMDTVRGLASYIAWNPVEAGLVERPEQYPYLGSERFSIAELASFPQVKPLTGDL